MHGLIFFYLQKFADSATAGATSWRGVRTNAALSTTKYLPAGVYPDADAVAILTTISETLGRPLPAVIADFGRFLAPHLIKVAGHVVDPSWRTLDLIEHTESIIHSMIRTANPGASPPVLEAIRQSPDELHLLYSSARRLCPLATGLIGGIAAHYAETVSITEPSCMLRGDPFCSFVIERTHTDTHDPLSPLTETMTFTPPSARSADGVDGVTHATAAVPLTSAASGDHAPEAIGGHRVIASLGRGAMGQVFLAEDEHLGRRVAIKMMHPSRAGDATARARFLRESRATAAVVHPHVVTIHQVGEHRPGGAVFGLPYIVMQHLEGRTLADERKKRDRLPLPEVLRIGRQIAEGLWAAHRRGLLHRDVKPENILLEGPSREVKLIDFGLARDLDADAGSDRVTQHGVVVGTPAYMAPERVGDGAVDARGDLFGLGVVLYEMLAGRLPFEGASMMAMLAAISRGEPKPLADVAPDVPPDVAALVMRLIAHDPADRPASAEEVVRELAALERRHDGG